MVFVTKPKHAKLIYCMKFGPLTNVILPLSCMSTAVIYVLNRLIIKKKREIP